MLRIHEATKTLQMSRNHVLTKHWDSLTCSYKGPIILGTTTSYGLEGPGIESLWEQNFLNPSTPALGPTWPPVHWVLALFLGSKAARLWS